MMLTLSPSALSCPITSHANDDDDDDDDDDGVSSISA